MTEIDWTGAPWLEAPLESFSSVSEEQEDGTVRQRRWPYGEGEAQRLMVGLSVGIEDAYIQCQSEEDWERLEATGEVAVIRNGVRGYERLDSLTLGDLPAILDTLVILEEEHKQRAREESERKAAARKERERVRAKERRKLKKLGEW